MVVKLVSLVVSCGAIDYQPTPPTNVLIGRAIRVTRLVAVLIIICLRYTEPAGLHESTRWESTHGLDSSCLIIVCGNHGTKLCGTMLITYVDDV